MSAFGWVVFGVVWLAALALFLVWWMGVARIRNAYGEVRPEKPWPRMGGSEPDVGAVQFGGPCPVCGAPGHGPIRKWTPCDRHLSAPIPIELLVRDGIGHARALAVVADAVNGHVSACDAEEVMAREEYRSDFGRDV